MSERISRRDFMKIAGMGAAASLVLTGCGTNARFVERRPYLSMPEYTLPGVSTYYATTCVECPAGCGIIVRTVEGRALKVEGNPDHPVNKGRTCARGQAAVQGLYNPDRFTTAVQQKERGSAQYEAIEWQQAIQAVAEALGTDDPSGLSFLSGTAPDHLYDLLKILTESLGVSAPLRFTGLSMLEQRVTLASACERVYGEYCLPHFDISGAEVIFSFGANFNETWLTPVSYSLAYGDFRKGTPGRRGYLVQFEPRLSMTAANADEWIPINPGSEHLLAAALGMLVQEMRGTTKSVYYSQIDLEDVATQCGIAVEEMQRLAAIFSRAERALAIPGAGPLGYKHGLLSAEAVLVLNGLVNNSGKTGGLSLPPQDLLADTISVSSSFADIQALVDRMNAGQVKTLFIHNTNPVFMLPPETGFVEALQNVPKVISFSSHPDETTLYADLVLPDHTPLESWGYQKISIGSNVRAISAMQPVVSPFHDTRSSVDIFLSALQAMGGEAAVNLPYADEVSFIQSRVLSLNAQDGFYVAPEEKTFWALWQQTGGWWQKENGLRVPLFNSALLDSSSNWHSDAGIAEDSSQFHLMIYPSQTLGDGSHANRPWLQETPDPMTTAMWDTWVEVNPHTAQRLGLENDDIVRLISAGGEITALVYLYPAIHPQVLALPVGQGHTEFGRFASGVGTNPFKLLQIITNEADDLAMQSGWVNVQRTGKKKTLARKESIPGVYGEDAG